MPQYLSNINLFPPFSAPDPSGPSFKSSSKRRIYIVVGVVCLLILVAVAVALGVYFGVDKGTV